MELKEVNVVGAEALQRLVDGVDAIARLDERARTSTLRDGWMARLMFEEACAVELAEGRLVHKKDLVLFDAGAAEEAYRLSRIGFEAGRISQLELRSTRAALIASRNAAVDARIARVRAEIDLARLEGRAPFGDSR